MPQSLRQAVDNLARAIAARKPTTGKPGTKPGTHPSWSQARDNDPSPSNDYQVQLPSVGPPMGGLVALAAAFLLLRR